MSIAGLAACNLARNLPDRAESIQVQEPTATATETLPPYTPLPTLTPSRTLKPPPTFRPPTATILPSVTPLAVPSSTLDLSVDIPGLRGNETPTPTPEIACKIRKDWKLTYTVQQDDALVRIAALYNTSAEELAEGNCLKDKNLIIVGQVLKVPGDVQPVRPEVQCGPYEVLTPLDGAFSVGGGGVITFDWHGPRAPRNLVRIIRPDGSKFEAVVDLRQNEEVDLDRNLPAAGTYTWYVYPLDRNFVQVCPEGGPWTFTKPQAPAPP
jgi:LysM repeat protein